MTRTFNPCLNCGYSPKTSSIDSKSPQLDLIPTRKLSQDSNLNYSIVEILNSKFQDINEFSNSLVEISERINNLNSNSWNSVYMVRKQQ